MKNLSSLNVNKSLYMPIVTNCLQFPVGYNLIIHKCDTTSNILWYIVMVLSFKYLRVIIHVGLKWSKWIMYEKYNYPIKCFIL